MRRKTNGKIVIGCSIVAAICFGIVSYGHFYRGRMELGWIFAILTAAQLVLAVLNYRISKKYRKPMRGNHHESQEHHFPCQSDHLLSHCL